MPTNSNDNSAVRIAAFRWLKSQVELHGEDVLPRDLPARGFEFEGVRVPLLGPQGIFKPAILPEIPISITTSPNSPYNDSFTKEGLLSYRYRGTDPMHRENVGLRNAMAARIPLIYFHGVDPGRYLAVWPVFIVADSPGDLTFTVMADVEDIAEDAANGHAVGAGISREDGRRIYITSTVKVRLHQRGFRERVLRAYQERCTLCRLRHRNLLDAAHIVPDADESGDPVVSNGLSLCKIHHAAFDQLLIGIRPDYVVEVHPRILEEKDGPMLKHGLQAVHGTTINLPRAVADRPDPERLNVRYNQFRGAA